jgi:signal peptidase I
MSRHRKQHTKSVIREWGESIFVAFLLAMFIREFFFQAFRIPTGSMRPTLIEGDRLLVNKLRYGPKIRFTMMRIKGFGRPQRGDIIVFKYPEDPERDFIKRLIAFGGETVEIKLGDVYINGRLIEDPLIKNTYYFVLGDNSASSSDSRYWGFVTEHAVVGRAELIYWPPHRIRFLR